MSASWWIDPVLQRSYPLFAARVVQELPRMTQDKGAAMVDSVHRTGVMRALDLKPSGSRWGSGSGEAA